MTTRFTVVIPTRDRCDTLEWALKTCVAQDHDNFEILVSDNNSMDRTEEVVRSYDDPRIRYVNTGRRLSMTDNFEFALSHVTDGFVTCIGDDDGLVPNALTELDDVIRQHACKAIIWPRQPYFWPGVVRPYFANTLHMNLFQNNSVREVDASEMLREVIAFRHPYYNAATLKYYNLPSIYYGFIHHDVIRAVTARSGRFFHSITPDIYSSVAIACVLDTYHISSKAYALSGLSHHSNGASMMLNTYHKSSTSEGQKYLSENTLPFHPDLVMAPAIALLVAESYLQARDHLDCPDAIAVDLRRVIRAAIEDRALLSDPGLYAAVVSAVEQTAAMHGLEEYAREVIAHYHYRSLPVLTWTALRLIFSPDSIFLCDRFSVTNIYEATLTFDRLLKRYRSPVMKSAIYLRRCLTKTKLLVDLELSKRMGRIFQKNRRRTTRKSGT